MRKKIIRFALIVVVFLSGGTKNICGQMQDLDCLVDKCAAKYHAQVAQFSGAGQEYDLQYADLKLHLDPTQARIISGRVRFYLKAKVLITRSLSFDCSDSLQVDSILYHKKRLSYVHKDHVLTAQLPTPFLIHSLDSITIYYKGNPPQTGFGSFTADSIGGKPGLWTLSQPYGARDWWPTKQSLDDKIDSIDIELSVPYPNYGVSIGKLVFESRSSSTCVTRWRHRYPVAAYLVAVAVGQYRKTQHYVPLTDGSSLLFENFVINAEDSLRLAKEMIAHTKVLQYYDRLFGKYPFAKEKYGLTQFGWGGGMEHQTNSFVGVFQYELLNHELAHQWFGDLVTCGSWQDIWLNEGFATYLSALAYEEFLPYYWRRWRELNLKTITRTPGGSVWVEDTSEVKRIFDSRLSYQKGAYVLHQLRWLMGDDAFFSACRSFLADPKLRFGYARTTDFIKHCQAHTRRALNPYFDKWIYKQGHPSYHIEWSQQADNRTFLQVSQTTSHPSVDFFEQPLPILLKGYDVWGNQRDTLFTVEHTFSGQTFELKPNFLVDSIILDPELWLIKDTVSYTSTTLPLNVRVYPCPAQGDFIFLQLNQAPSALQAVEMIEPIGKVTPIFSRNDLQAMNARALAINISNLANGVYWLKVQTNNQKLIRPFIVHR